MWGFDAHRWGLPFWPQRNRADWHVSGRRWLMACRRRTAADALRLGMSAMLNNITSLECLKVVLFALFCATTIGVIIGVYLEQDEYAAATQKIGWRLLLYSLGAELFFSVLIFCTDSRITALQRTEIIRLDSKLVALAPRQQLLQGHLRSGFISNVKSFPGQKVETRYCRAYPQPSFDDEAIGTAMLIASALVQAGWESPHAVPVANCGGEGIFISTESDAPESTRNAARALLLALSALPVTAGDAGTPEATGQPKPQSPDTIVVLVLSHPL
jgi:hypothetical protein